MVKAKSVVGFIEKMFSNKYRTIWDTTQGLIKGNINKEINKIIVSLELRKNILNKECDFILLHHPPLFGENKSVTNPYYTQISDDTVVYAIHSSMDVNGFANQAIIKKVFENKIKGGNKVLEDGTVIIELTEEQGINDIIKLIKNNLSLETVKTIIQKDKIKKIAVHGGEGFSKNHIDLAVKENIDLYLGGDLDHHAAENASFHKINYIDISHHTEQEGMKMLSELLIKEFSNLKIEFVPQKEWWDYK